MSPLVLLLLPCLQLASVVFCSESSEEENDRGGGGGRFRGGGGGRAPFHVTKLSALTSTVSGSGMDKPGLFGWGGGIFSIRLCSQGECCVTPHLNTEDNNWELGQVDMFVGSGQIGGCFNFSVSDSLSLTLMHSGSNGGRLDWVRVYPWHSASYWECPVGRDLDHTSSHTAQCTKKLGHHRANGTWCNGAPEFCSLSVDEFLWAGSHNSGTGQNQGSMSCAFKNQDLDITAQLELGIRFFDVDTIYDIHLPGCHGLETGHGNSPEMGIYQCFGLLKNLLTEAGLWLDNHPTEVIMFDFGNIEYKVETIPRLMEELRETFPREGRTVKMNTNFKENGSWPTLGQAVDSNERIFVFIRDTIGVIEEDDLEFVNEINVKPAKMEEVPLNKSDTEVMMMTSYKAKSVGDCTYVLDTNKNACFTEFVHPMDFLKLSLFSKFGKGGPLGLDCVHKMAKRCNRWVEGSILNCNYKKFRPNMILLDYPNYQGQQKQSFVQLVERENFKRARQLIFETESAD